MKLSTQKQLIAYAVKHHACLAARDYIARFPAHTPAKEIWLKCRHHEWLLWLGARWNPEVALGYARKTIKRIVVELDKQGFTEEQRHYLTVAERDCVTAGNYLECGDKPLFYMSLHWAYYEAHRAAANYNVESEIRLQELHKMW